MKRNPTKVPITRVKNVFFIPDLKEKTKIKNKKENKERKRGKN